MTKEQNLNKYFSTPRLQPYFTAGGDIVKGMELYQLNMRLAGAFWPLLSVLEVALRNAIDYQLSKYFGQDDWFEKFEKLLEAESTQKINALKAKYGEPPKGYESSESLKSTAGTIEKHKLQIIKNKKKAIKDGIKRYLRKLDWFKKMNEFEQFRVSEEEYEKELKCNPPISVTRSQIIADLNFSFWTSFFKEELYKCLQGTLINIFPNKDSKINRKALANMLDEIRNFRNRVAHNESLFFVDRKFNLTKVKSIQNHIQNILLYLNEDLTEFADEIYIIHSTLASVESFVKNLPVIIGIETDED